MDGFRGEITRLHGVWCNVRHGWCCTLGICIYQSTYNFGSSRSVDPTVLRSRCMAYSKYGDSNVSGSTDILTSIVIEHGSFFDPGYSTRGVVSESLGAKDYFGTSVELVWFLHVDAVCAIRAKTLSIAIIPQHSFRHTYLD